MNSDYRQLRNICSQHLVAPFQRSGYVKYRFSWFLQVYINFVRINDVEYLKMSIGRRSKHLVNYNMANLLIQKNVISTECCYNWQPTLNYC